MDIMAQNAATAVDDFVATLLICLLLSLQLVTFSRLVLLNFLERETSLSSSS
jgi:hypothetical protein